MTNRQKISLIAACISYALTVAGFFFFNTTVVLLMLIIFAISMCAFAYSCFKIRNDYTGAEHLQQEIGILTAEKTQLKNDYETLIKEKDEELEKRQLTIGRLGDDLALAQMSVKEAKDELEEFKGNSVKEGGEFDSLLPPDDDDTANVDIIEIAKAAINELSEAAKKVGLRITISSASEKLMVHASKKRLLIMFRNIIDNSIKYMQTQGNLVITISTIDNDIFIVLKDTGKGLPENETKHIFELNFQGSNRISGNGLGLTQAKAIVEHYGGTIYARSPEGNGMGIYIQLPTN
ncbi:sensor histidine kinase [Butyrivibrio sp. AE3004]|uniref:sensor histidine kinase n=1 Tax=Butyrivibrio sp. AE3004 TaxID=1506994 RepID=UPI0004946E53|nr:HAMP domain-containing sensor histidine kinase [Butyrivibrio sp. AE3004]